jgi:hypothetical protein
MYVHLENTEVKETWEAIGCMKEPIHCSREDKISRRIRRVKKELNYGAANVNSYMFYTYERNVSVL